MSYVDVLILTSYETNIYTCPVLHGTSSSNSKRTLDACELGNDSLERDWHVNECNISGAKLNILVKLNC